MSGRASHIPMAQAVIRSLAVNAAKGNQRAQRLFTELLEHASATTNNSTTQWFPTAITYKVEWDEELARCKNFGVEAPPQIPHPDDIMIDMITGLVRNQRTSNQSKSDEDQLRDLKATIKLDIEEMTALLAAQPEDRDQINEEIQHSQRVLKMILAVVGDRYLISDYSCIEPSVTLSTRLKPAERSSLLW